MTKEEAIEWLKSLNYCDGEETQEVAQAIDMAIKALEQQKPMEKFENAKDHIRKLAGDYKCYDNRLTDEEALELCHILEQQSSDDCVSRQAVLDILSHYAHNLGADNEIKALSSVTPTHGTCKDCKHWKDSDGVYRRGVGAESKCPINTKEVYEGNFYCKDFEKRGSENDSN